VVVVILTTAKTSGVAFSYSCFMAGVDEKGEFVLGKSCNSLQI